MLDLRTLYLAIACIYLCLGAMQIAAFTTRRFGRWVLCWALSSLLVGAGLLMTGLRDMIPPALSIHAANLATISGNFLLLASVRMFTGRKPHWMAYAVIGAAVSPFIFGIWSDAAAFAPRIALVSVLCAGCDLAVCADARRVIRDEGLASAKILMALFGLTTILFSVRAILAASGWSSPGMFEATPPSQSIMAAAAGAIVVLRALVLLLMAVERADKAWERLAFRDALTGALNAAGLKAGFERWRSDPARARKLSALSIQVEGLDHTADAKGPATAERLLKLLNAVVLRHGRPGQLLARMGTQQFVLLLPGAAHAEAEQTGRHLRSAFEALAGKSGGPRRATLTFGAAEASSSNPVLGLLLNQADGARRDAPKHQASQTLTAARA
ncbi:diguanylate cyclase [Caulobacter segnis]|uniref:GGDEF domain-containing protein n=1 Tax=Caulobacter segnis TaxID=88688 RepID=UPI00240ECBD6|nr:diguanylate cyclase [Caulobacter segnis]MDG2521105.1 diguanylate cyclase [Caulobacter segnis]